VLIYLFCFVFLGVTVGPKRVLIVVLRLRVIEIILSGFLY